MNNIYNITCKGCPVECNMEALRIDNQYQIKGNRCPRGKQYAINSLTNPTRILTGRVVLEGGKIRQLPVKTTGPISEDKIDQGLEFLRNFKVQAPVKRGQILIENFLDLGVDLISARKA